MTNAVYFLRQQDNVPAYAASFQGGAKQAVNQAREKGSLSAVLMPDALAQRQALARKQASKIVGDAFAGEKKIDAGIQGMRDHSDMLRKDNLKAGDEITATKALIDDARKLHGIEEGSEEDRELELLRRAGSPEALLSMSDEEQSKVKEIKERGLSQSQLDFMEHTGAYFDQIAGLEKQMAENDAVIRANGGAERQIKIERLKTDPIRDAEAEADAIMDEANKDMIDSLFAEAKDHIDEEREKAEEAAEEKAEEEAEQQEKIDAVKEKKAEQEALAEAIREKLRENEDATSGATHQNRDQGSHLQEILDTANTQNPAAPDLADIKEVQDQINAKVNKVLDKLKLIPEDIKGVKVDDVI